MLLVLDVAMVNMFPLYRQGNEGSENLDNLPSVTHRLRSGGAEILCGL